MRSEEQILVVRVTGGVTPEDRQVSESTELGMLGKYLQVRTTTANFHVTRDAAIVILIVQILIITSVLSTITEINAKPSLTADVKISTKSEGSLLADAEIYILLGFMTFHQTYKVSSREAM